MVTGMAGEGGLTWRESGRVVRSFLCGGIAGLLLITLK